MYNCNKTYPNFKIKPYEIHQESMEFLQIELHDKVDIKKSVMETQRFVLENHIYNPGHNILQLSNV